MDTITEKGKSVVSVDSLEVAQFIHLLLSREKIREVKGAIIDEAFSKHKELLFQKAEKMKTRTTEDYLKDSE